jgi:hypothetical protein
MKTLFAVLTLFALSGCAGFQQAMSGYESSAAKGINAAQDNSIGVWAYAACNTSYAAAIRNPQVIPALKALCLPQGADGNPVTLLDSVPKK